jgi:hypothetical protein
VTGTKFLHLIPGEERPRILRKTPILCRTPFWYGGNFGRLQVASRAENGRSRFLAVTGMGPPGRRMLRRGVCSKITPLIIHSRPSTPIWLETDIWTGMCCCMVVLCPFWGHVYLWVRAPFGPYLLIQAYILSSANSRFSHWDFPRFSLSYDL